MTALRHALRTLLNQTLGYTRILIEGAEERTLAQLVSDLQKIHAAGQQLLALIDVPLGHETRDAAGFTLPLRSPGE